MYFKHRCPLLFLPSLWAPIPPSPAHRARDCMVIHLLDYPYNRQRATCVIVFLCDLGEHKPGRIKPGRIKRAALSLQNQNGYIFDVCRVKYPGTKQLPIHISGAGFAPNSQIWFLGTTPFDTTPFICLRVTHQTSRQRRPADRRAGEQASSWPHHCSKYVYVIVYLKHHHICVHSNTSLYIVNVPISDVCIYIYIYIYRH